MIERERGPSGCSARQCAPVRNTPASEQSVIAIDDPVEAEAQRVLGERRGRRRLLERFPYCLCHLLIVADRNQATEAAAVQNFRRPARAVGAAYPTAAGHGFDQYIRQPERTSIL